MSDKRLNILHISASYVPAWVYGGPIRSMAALCEGLVKSGAHVQVYCTTANGKKELQRISGRDYDVNGVRVRYFKRWTGDHSHFSPRLLWAVWNDCSKYDLVHIHSWWNLVSVMSALICRSRGVRPVISLRGTLSEETFRHGHRGIKKALHALIGRRILHNACIHVTSEKEFSEVRKNVSPEDVHIIPNVLNLPVDGQPVPVRQRNGLHLVFVGRINPIKNLDLLLDVVMDPEVRRLHCTLDIIGTGEGDYIRSLQRKTNGLEYIRWLGDIDGEEKFTHMRNADLLCLPSHSENFGNVVIEALSQGTPVLITEQVGIAAYIRKHDLGWVVSPIHEVFVRALQEIAGNPQVLEDIRRRSPQVIKQDFDDEAIVAQYLALYKHHLIPKA